MPNIGAVLRQEITRLSRKESKSQNDGIKKATTHFRQELAALKRKIVLLERATTSMQRTLARGGTATAPVAEVGAGTRFSAKGLRSLRKRLGLTSAELGTILNVSSQSVYNWERGHARPRAAQIEKIASLRKVGKKEVRAFLGEAQPEEAAAAATTAAPRARKTTH